jgi:GNAT superfamily N-acetyltransferase
VHLAYQDGMLVGAIIVTISDTTIPQFCVAALCVRPTYRNQGIGLELMQRALQAIADKLAPTHPDDSELKITGSSIGVDDIELKTDACSSTCNDTNFKTTCLSATQPAQVIPLDPLSNFTVSNLPPSGPTINENIQDSEKTAPLLRSYVTLHVQHGNSEAISVYERVGFVRTNSIRNYYPRLADPHCYLMSKLL